MLVQTLAIPDLKMILPRRFQDVRGAFVETFSERAFRDKVAPFAFVQDNDASSVAPGTVRGLHYQLPPAAQGKLIRVSRGAIIDVAVDIRVGSATYGRSVAVRLDEADGAQLWVPPGFAHGYCTLEPDTVVAYKVTAFYSPADDAGLLWNDPDLAIEWPVDAATAILSHKDREQPRFADLPPTFRVDAHAGVLQ